MELKITVDRSKCSGHARCAMKGPDVYELDDEGFCISDGKIVTDESLRTQVIHGMKACPERAISVIEA
ncbi:ferredoxin [Novosphingobium hassiacum]|uniref:Ferredoxin n=1 Tax=Novosphingobium hassiacum TaxID=173676 RepID=A0A7W5ZWV3_9SPHN|nr:ferredoxin [Novosphingobium hassiacum]MBB3860951.1 ferredoxin [Novosphingobium hassiacum]